MFKFRTWNKSNRSLCSHDKMCYGVDNPNCEATDVMQYTGLIDKNKKEIYEGDIVKAYHDEWECYNITPVVFINGTFSLGTYWKDGIHDWNSMEQYSSFNMEVIGNIYENPKLID